MTENIIDTSLSTTIQKSKSVQVNNNLLEEEEKIKALVADLHLIKEENSMDILDSSADENFINNVESKSYNFKEGQDNRLTYAQATYNISAYGRTMKVVSSSKDMIKTNSIINKIEKEHEQPKTAEWYHKMKN